MALGIRGFRNESPRQLARLADDDRASTDDEDAVNVSALGHLCNFRFTIADLRFKNNPNRHSFVAEIPADIIAFQNGPRLNTDMVKKERQKPKALMVDAFEQNAPSRRPALRS
jgi:hypothetical protein